MFEQVKLEYGFNELEPFIDALTVETHYAKHHANYTKTFNDLVEKVGLSGKSAVEILKGLSSVDETLRKGLKNNGGGYFNHNLYFMNLSPNAQHEASGKLRDKINEQFGDLEGLKTRLTALALGQFGSGWAFMSVSKDGSLVLTQSSNQDNPYSEGLDVVPILALDVWEHAYYLKYRNLRGDYIKAFFEVLDWGKVSKLYEELV